MARGRLCVGERTELACRWQRVFAKTVVVGEREARSCSGRGGFFFGCFLSFFLFSASQAVWWRWWWCLSCFSCSYRLARADWTLRRVAIRWTSSSDRPLMRDRDQATCTKAPTSRGRLRACQTGIFDMLDELVQSCVAPPAAVTGDWPALCVFPLNPYMSASMRRCSCPAAGRQHASTTAYRHG